KFVWLITTSLTSTLTLTTLNLATSLFFYCYGDHRDLHNNRHSFPTRRSSDLPGERGRLAVRPPGPVRPGADPLPAGRSEEHTSELQSPVVISYAVFCLKKK